MSETDAPAAPQTERKGPWPLIAIVAAITLILILLVPGDEEPETPAPSAPVAEGDTPAPSLLTPATDTPDTGTPATPLEAAPQNLPPGAAARALIAELRQQSPMDLERAFSTAGQQQQGGHHEDAYLLYFFAAREGHAESAMTLARQADPASFAAGGLFEAADELQAHKWYSKAADAGHPEATDAIKALRGRVEQAAAAGDERAHRIMLQWK